MSAIKRLIKEKNKWLARAEFYRKAMMEAHANKDYEGQEYYSKLCSEATDGAHWLGYAIDTLDNN